MKKRLIALLLVMVMIASLAACSSSAKPAEQASSEAETAEQVSSETRAGESGDVDARVSEILGKMTPEQKLSQMMVVALR